MITIAVVKLFFFDKFFHTKICILTALSDRTGEGLLSIVVSDVSTTLAPEVITKVEQIHYSQYNIHAYSSN